MDKAWDRVNIGLRERPLSSDINRAESQIYRTISELMQQLFGGAVGSQTGFLGASLGVVASNPAAMSVQVKAGLGFIFDPTDVPVDIGSPDLESVDDLSAFKPVLLNNPVTFAVQAAPGAPNTRIDIIEVKIDRQLVDSTPREQLDTGTKQFVPKSFFKTLTYSLDGFTGTVTSPANSTAGLSYKIGVAANPGVAPATTPGYIKLAEVHVGSAVVTIVTGNITDFRTMLVPLGARLGQQIITANGTYTPTPGTTRVRVRMVGGGGGAGGNQAAAGGQVAVTGGGGPGTMVEFRVGDGKSLITGGAVTIGTGGAGGTAANGTAGGDTTALIGGTTYTAKGGGASNTMAGVAPPIVSDYGVFVAGSSAGDFVAGQNATAGIAQTTANVIGGAGGSNPLGQGGTGSMGSGGGGNATGYGGGGGGTASAAGVGAHTGGNGSPGVVIIDEYL